MLPLYEFLFHFKLSNNLMNIFLYIFIIVWAEYTVTYI